MSRITPTDFCAAARVGFSANAEDRYDFKPVATDPASGKVTNASGARAGTLHACFGRSSDSLIANFYAEGDVGGVSLVGHGQCRMTKGDFWIRWRPADDKHARIAHAPWTRHRSTGLHASVDRYGPPVEDAIEAAAHVIS